MQELIDKLLLAGAFQAFFLLALLVRKKEKARHDYILGLWLAFLGLYIAGYAISPVGFFTSRPGLIGLYISLLLLIGPFLFIYVSALISESYRFRAALLWHLLPFVMVSADIFYWGFPEDLIPSGGSGHPVENRHLSWLFLFLLIPVALSVPGYIIRTVIVLRQHRKRIADNFSSVESRNLVWLRNLILILGGVWGMFLIVFFIHHVLFLFSDTFCINGLFFSLSAFIIAAGYFGFHQPAIFVSHSTVSFMQKEESNIRYSGSSLREDDLLKSLTLLKEYMVREKPYLNNELTLPQLSEALDLPIHTLSRVINEYHQQNFYDFINQYRIEEFKQRVADPRYSSFTLLAIAFDCGFNSKSAFNRIFKTATGMTPSEYRRSQGGAE